MTSRNFI